MALTQKVLLYMLYFKTKLYNVGYFSRAGIFMVVLIIQISLYLTFNKIPQIENLVTFNIFRGNSSTDRSKDVICLK